MRKRRIKYSGQQVRRDWVTIGCEANSLQPGFDVFDVSFAFTVVRRAPRVPSQRSAHGARRSFSFSLSNSAALIWVVRYLTSTPLPPPPPRPRGNSSTVH